MPLTDAVAQYTVHPEPYVPLRAISAFIVFASTVGFVSLVCVPVPCDSVSLFDIVFHSAPRPRLALGSSPA